MHCSTFLLALEHVDPRHRMSPLCHAQAPEPEAVNQFVWDLFSYLMQNPDKWVVVHCTHGFNRTGTLLAQYLIVTAMQHAQ